MGLLDKRLAAAFFRPEWGSPAEELERAGATDIARAPGDDVSGLLDCRWAGLPCRAFVHEHVFAILFAQSAFLDLRPDGDGPLVRAFVTACERLRPDAAVIVTHLHQAEVEELQRLARIALEADAPERLAAEHVGLLYLNGSIFNLDDGPWLGDNREEIPIDGGRLIFAGRGELRWA